MTVMAVRRFQRFFRAAAGLNVDKNDLKAYSDFVNRKTYDLLVVGVGVAGANGRDLIEPWDLPITKGLEESIHEFRRIAVEVELRDVLEQLATLPPLTRACSEETEARMPDIVGGISMALAKTLRSIDPRMKNPQPQDWDRVEEIFDTLL